jgi:membrane protein implicated in regulation of membrane protease activity
MLFAMLLRLGIAHAAATPTAGVIFVLAILLAVFLLDWPWNWIAVGAAAIWEIAQLTGAIWWSQRRRAQTGAEALRGTAARVVSRCAPFGTVAVRGEIWNARCEGGAEVGEHVRVRGLQGLTLVVERDQLTVNAPASHQRQ